MFRASSALPIAPRNAVNAPRPSAINAFSESWPHATTHADNPSNCEPRIVAATPTSNTIDPIATPTRAGSATPRRRNTPNGRF